ncbi:MAG: protein kinase [Planctomycetes bacterium]|nr:protein kinase [Planctomycetota bacterium]
MANLQEFTEFVDKNRIMDAQESTQFFTENMEKISQFKTLDDFIKFLLDEGYLPLSHLVNELESNNSADLIPDEVRSKLNDDAHRFGKYVKLRELGRGGNSIVYKAYDLTLKRHVALKIFKDSASDDEQQFIKEAETIASLEHPNIVPIYEIEEIQNNHFIAMKLIDGVTLDKLIGKIDQRKCAEILLKVCDAVDYAHSMGIIHRDIKPQNIIIDKSDWVYVLDFGIAKNINTDPTYTYHIVGTPLYMSPEQVSGTDIDQRSDIYSLGSTFYHCLAHKPPMRGVTQTEMLEELKSCEFPPIRSVNRKVAKDLESIVSKCMYKEPELRYQSADELRSDIKKFLNGNPISARAPSFSYKLSKFINKYRVHLLIVLAVCIISAAIFIPIYLKNLGSAETEGQETGKKNAQKLRQLATPSYESGSNSLSIAVNAHDDQLRKKISGYFKKAIEDFTTALNIDKTYSQAYLKRGETFMRIGKFDDAISDFGSAIDNDPNLSGAYYLRIFAQHLRFETSFYLPLVPRERLDKQLLIDDFNHLKNLKILPAKISCVQGIIKIHELKFKKAEEFFSEAIKADSTFADAYFLRGLSRLLRLGRYAKSELPEICQLTTSDFTKVSIYDPNNINLYIYAATNFRLNGEITNALTAIDAAKLLDKTNLKVLLTEALVYFSGREDTKAFEILQQTKTFENNITNKKELAGFYYNRGTIKWMLKERESAEADFQQALSTAPEDIKENIESTIKSFKESNK